MKAVSNIVATIILLSLTMVLIGVTSAYFAHTTQYTQDQLEQQASQQEALRGSTIRIHAVGMSEVFVKNTGSRNISAGDMSIYIDNVPVSCVWDMQQLPVASVALCTLPAPCPGNGVLRVTPPGNEDAAVCESVQPGPAPVVTLVAPMSGAALVAPATILFNCRAQPFENITRIELWTNLTHVRARNITSYGYSLVANLSLNVPGSYEWICQARNVQGEERFATTWQAFTIAPGTI